MVVLEQIDTEFGRIKVVKSRRDGTHTYYQGGCFHSEATAEGISTCAYVHVMYSIIRQSGARDVLMIGCAGGTLATMLQKFGCRVTAVDINPHAFDFARKYFGMPEEVECVLEDGWSYLRRTGRRFDAIAIDAFHSDGTIPAPFMTDDFCSALKEVLKPSGVVTMNFVIEHDNDMLADRMAMRMKRADLPAVLFDWPGQIHRNTVLAGGAAVEQMQIDLHKKPPFIRDDMSGVVHRSCRELGSRPAIQGSVPDNLPRREDLPFVPR